MSAVLTCTLTVGRFTIEIHNYNLKLTDAVKQLRYNVDDLSVFYFKRDHPVSFSYLQLYSPTPSDGYDYIFYILIFTEHARIKF